MANFRRLQLHWYRKAGISEDIERGGLLVHEFGSRATDAQDLGFAGEMAEAAAAILRHPALTRQKRNIWRLHCCGKTYREIAEDVSCSFREVSGTIDFAQTLMLRPQWETYEMAKEKKGKAGRPPSVHKETANGAACGKDVVKSLLTSGWSDVTCKRCQDIHGGAPAKKVAKPTVRVRREAAPAKRRGRPPANRTALPDTLVTDEERAQLASLEGEFETLIIPPSGNAAFKDIEDSIAMGVEVAHRKIVELHAQDSLSSMDVATNERAVHTLLAVRKSELEYLKGKVPPKEPDEARAQQIAGTPEATIDPAH